MFKELFKRSNNKVLPQDRFFSSIFGYTDIKKLLMRAIVSRESISILLCGPPASSKTVFLMEMKKGLNNTCYVDCTNTTGAGLVDKLFNNNIQYLLLDEIEKMSKRDQNVLLNVIETGMLVETKISKTKEQTNEEPQGFCYYQQCGCPVSTIEE